MAKAVNYILNKNGCIGFDQVLVEIEAFNYGSFDIKGRIKRITENPTFASISAALVTLLITKAISIDTTPTMVINNYEGGNVNITYDQLIDNKELIRARSNIAKTATSDPHVSSISITYKQNNGNVETRTIDLTTLESIIVEDCVDNNVETTTYYNSRLRIIAPVLESEPASWKVSLGDRKISAHMQDEGFLKKMDETKIAFGKGDIIIADLVVEVNEKDGKKSHPKYFIKKVHKYPHYSVNSESILSLSEK